MLRLIAMELEAGRPLFGQQTQYLCAAILKILRGVDANRALSLRRTKGAQRRHYARDLRIYQRVFSMVTAGKSQRYAFKKVADLEHSRGRTMTESNVGRIYRRIHAELPIIFRHLEGA
jgi:hypothetical protein